MDSEVCLKAKCPFVVKNSFSVDGEIIPIGVCSRALILRQPKIRVCISNVDIRRE